MNIKEFAKIVIFLQFLAGVVSLVIGFFEGFDLMALLSLHGIVLGATLASPVIAVALEWWMK